MAGHSKQRRSRASRVRLAVGASTSAVLLVAGLVATGVATTNRGAVLPLPVGLGDHASIQQTVQTQVCPAQMALIDTASYGDEAFRTTPGNIATRYRVASLGSLVAGQYAELNSQGVLWDMATNTDGVQTAAGTTNDNSSIVQAMLTKQQEGFGITGSVVSNATEGDLRGTSAIACGSAVLSSHFLLPSTKTGYAQQLVLTNTSAKPTTVRVRVHGTSSNQPLALNTESAVNVNAQSNQVINLSAAAPDEQGIYVEVDADVAPVFAHVRIVATQGLTPQGSEQVPVVGADGAITGAIAQLDTTAYAYSEQSGNAAWYWIDSQGEHKAKDITLQGGTVAVTDLGKAPDGVIGAVLRARDTSMEVTSSLMQTMAGQQQSDFMMASPATRAGSSAIALPEQSQATVHIVNNDTNPVQATLTAYDAQGKTLATKAVSLEAHTGVSVETQDFQGQSALLVLDTNNDQGYAPLQWSAIIHGMSDHDTANLAQILPTPLEPSSAQVSLQYNQHVVS